MASKTLICLASPPGLVSNKASLSIPSQNGLGQRYVVFRGPSKKPSLVVRAQAKEGESSTVPSKPIEPSGPLHFNNLATLIDTSPYSMKNPWSNTSEDKHEIKMGFDVPGLDAKDIDVNIMDNLMIIKGAGTKTQSAFDCNLQLPYNCAKDKVKAVLKNGVLNITVPKNTKPEHIKLIHVPVTAN